MGPINTKSRLLRQICESALGQPDYKQVPHRFPNRTIQDTSFSSSLECGNTICNHDDSNVHPYTLMWLSFFFFATVGFVFLYRVSNYLSDYSVRSRHGGHIGGCRPAEALISVGALIQHFACFCLSGCCVSHKKCKGNPFDVHTTSTDSATRNRHRLQRQTCPELMESFS